MSCLIRIGTAGWSIPRASQDRFPPDGSHLERYAATLKVVEINSSFYRPHKPETYRRWAASVGPDFRFAVKLPKAITHERRLADADAPLQAFADQIAGLGEKRAVVLVQLPPSLMFDPDPAERFLRAAATILPAQIVIEPRHPSWFSDAADVLLVAHRIARVAADPPPVPQAAAPGGWRGFHYFRLHGSPRIYWSDYADGDIAGQADAVEKAARTAETWVIYDNTAAGAATGNAVNLQRRVKHESDAA